MPLPPSAAAAGEQCAGWQHAVCAWHSRAFDGKLTFPHLQLHGPTPPASTQGEANIAACRGPHGFTYATERILLPERPWPLTEIVDATVPTLRAIEPTQPGVNALLDHGQWTREPDVRDLLPTATGLLPFIVHEAHCQQAKQKDKHAWKTAHDSNQAAPWGLTGYFLDPDLFQMLAASTQCPAAAA